MPELPELEALARALDPALSGRRVTAPPRCHFAVLKTASPPLAGLEGCGLGGVRRRAKTLLFDADDGTTLAVHLMSAGRIGLRPAGAARPKSAVLTVELDDGSALVATEGGSKRRMRVGRYDPAGLEALLAGLGPEPLDDAFDRAALDAVLDAAPHRLHPLLRDQRAIAGIGRAFANEILHAARLSPFALSNRLDAAGRERLLAAIKGVLGEALAGCVERQGLALPQRNDARLLRIHGHEGEPCPVCGDALRFVDYEEHRIVYCPTCQTGGRELKDRRLSRLLK